MKSAVTFFRKQLGFSGSTQHNGRGVYEMEINDDDITTGDIEQRLRYRLQQWQTKDMIEKLEEDTQYISITLRDSLFDVPKWKQQFGDMIFDNNSYRTLCFNKQYGNLGVIMTFKELP